MSPTCPQEKHRGRRGTCHVSWGLCPSYSGTVQQVLVYRSFSHKLEFFRTGSLTWDYSTTVSLESTVVKRGFVGEGPFFRVVIRLSVRHVTLLMETPRR